MKTSRNPAPTVDIIIELSDGIVLIKRRFEPLGWAIPGGFVEYGETVENAAVREAVEETGLEVELTTLLGVYSDPRRDPRRHTMAIAYVATASGLPVAGDDAAEAIIVTRETLPQQMAFDHNKILRDYFHYKDTGELPRPDSDGSDLL